VLFDLVPSPIGPRLPAAPALANSGDAGITKFRLLADPSLDVVKLKLYREIDALAKMIWLSSVPRISRSGSCRFVRIDYNANLSANPLLDSMNFRRTPRASSRL
jgi:hypothetical protein